jgi:putative endonuclease
VSGSARQGLGAAGERHARRHLEQQGYQFIAANWRCQFGELDLVMRDGEMLVFVEVKTRRGERMGGAEESVTQVKARRLLMAAQTFLTNNRHHAAAIWRVDLVAITLGASGAVTRLTHYVDAIRAG